MYLHELRERILLERVPEALVKRRVELHNALVTDPSRSLVRDRREHDVAQLQATQAECEMRDVAVAQRAVHAYRLGQSVQQGVRLQGVAEQVLSPQLLEDGAQEVLLPLLPAEVPVGQAIAVPHIQQRLLPVEVMRALRPGLVVGRVVGGHRDGDVDPAEGVGHVAEPGPVDDRDVVDSHVGDVLHGLDGQGRAAEDIGPVDFPVPVPRDRHPGVPGDGHHVRAAAPGDQMHEHEGVGAPADAALRLLAGGGHGGPGVHAADEERHVLAWGPCGRCRPLGGGDRGERVVDAPHAVHGVVGHQELGHAPAGDRHGQDGDAEQDVLAGTAPP